jgi:hypothetical protein
MKQRSLFSLLFCAVINAANGQATAQGYIIGLDSTKQNVILLKKQRSTPSHTYKFDFVTIKMEDGQLKNVLPEEIMGYKPISKA